MTGRDQHCLQLRRWSFPEGRSGQGIPVMTTTLTRGQITRECNHKAGVTLHREGKGPMGEAGAQPHSAGTSSF